MGEVISVAARRRRWTLEQKLALVEEVSRPGASVAAVAGRHGMSRSLLFEWRRQVREGTMPGVMRADVAATLVPLRIVDDAPRKESARPQMPSRRSAERAGKSVAMVEVILSNGRMLRVAELGLQAKTLEAERLRQERYGRSSERLAGEVEQLELRLDGKRRFRALVAPA